MDIILFMGAIINWYIFITLLTKLMFVIDNPSWKTFWHALKCVTHISNNITISAKRWSLSIRRTNIICNYHLVDNYNTLHKQTTILFSQIIFSVYVNYCPKKNIHNLVCFRYSFFLLILRLVFSRFRIPRNLDRYN